MKQISHPSENKNKEQISNKTTPLEVAKKEKELHKEEEEEEEKVFSGLPENPYLKNIQIRIPHPPKNSKF